MNRHYRNLLTQKPWIMYTDGGNEEGSGGGGSGKKSEESETEFEEQEDF